MEKCVPCSSTHTAKSLTQNLIFALFFSSQHIYRDFMVVLLLKILLLLKIVAQILVVHLLLFEMHKKMKSLEIISLLGYAKNNFSLGNNYSAFFKGMNAPRIGFLRTAPTTFIWRQRVNDPVTYTNWDTNHPTVSNDCSAFYQTVGDGKWRSLSCATAGGYFLCMKGAATTDSPTNLPTSTPTISPTKAPTKEPTTSSPSQTPVQTNDCMFFVHKTTFCFNFYFSISFKIIPSRCKLVDQRRSCMWINSRWFTFSDNNKRN